MSVQSFPLVSVVMPSLNQARFIGAAIDSVLGQDYPNIELIVADGGSDDGTVDLLKARQASDKRLRWFSRGDSGPAQAINSALAEVRGTVVGWLNSDDLYTPGALRRTVDALQANQRWLMVYGHGQHVDGEGKPLDDYPSLPAVTPIKQFALGCFICQPTVFWRRSMGLLLGKLDEGLKAAFDFDYWLRAFGKFPDRIGFVDAVQACSRLHSDCITMRARRTVAVEKMQVLARHLGSAPKEWVLTYVEELLAQPRSDMGSASLREEVMSVFDVAREWLTPDDCKALAATLANDVRLDRTGMLDPVANATLAMEEFRAGTLSVRSTPRMLTLETTSRCNLRCVMCPHAIDAVSRPKHLEDHLIQKLHRFTGRATSIQLHGIGEPTASPAFWAMLPLLPVAERCESSINTNLTLLDDDRLGKLLDSNLKIVNVSLDAARPQTYQRIRGYSFERVVANLERLIAARHERGQRYPLVYLNMTLMRSNVEELPDFIRLSARLGVDCALLWHLNRWSDEEMGRYVIELEDWKFDYRREGLWNYPELSNRYLRDAEALAKELGVRVHLDHNKTVYFGNDNASA